MKGTWTIFFATWWLVLLLGHVCLEKQKQKQKLTRRITVVRSITRISMRQSPACPKRQLGSEGPVTVQQLLKTFLCRDFPGCKTKPCFIWLRHKKGVPQQPQFAQRKMEQKLVVPGEILFELKRHFRKLKTSVARPWFLQIMSCILEHRPGTQGFLRWKGT